MFLETSAHHPAHMHNEAHGVDSCPLDATMNTSERAQRATDNSCAMLGLLANSSDDQRQKN